MVKYNDSARHIHRPAPCPHYDVYGMEAWLEAMAREGYFLSADGFFLGFADFEVGKPTRMKYRLQAARSPRSAFDENHPEEGETELAEAMGWEYVARRGEFHIYRSADPDAPEMNTDAQVQALTLRAVSKRLPNHLISMILWLLVYPLIFFDEGIVRASIATGSAFAIFSLVMLLWIVLGELRAIIHIRRIRKKLEAAEHPTPGTYSREKAIRHICRRSIFILAVVLWIVITVLMFLRVGKADHPLSDYGGEAPFATLYELYTDAVDYREANLMDLYNYYEALSDPVIAPETLIWREMADVTLADGSIKEAALTVYYHEMSCELLAKIVAWEFLREAKVNKYYEEVPLPELGADYAAAYNDHFDAVIIRDGQRVIMASLLQYSMDAPIPLEQWAQTMADSIKE